MVRSILKSKLIIKRKTKKEFKIPVQLCHYKTPKRKKMKRENKS